MPIACTAAIGIVVTGAQPAFAAQADVGLGTATSFAVLGGSTVTNTGPTTISGDVGVAPGSAVTGFPPGLVSGGTIHAADAVALQAKNDLTTAYNDAAGRGPQVDETGIDLGGQTLQPGVYSASSTMGLTGTVTLDAQGDPNAVFILQAGSTLISASNSTVALIGAAQACHVYWQVGSSATIGTGTTFVGTVMALTDITMQTGARIQGRLLARTGQVALDDNTIARPSCASTTPTPTATPTASPSSSASVSTAPGSTATRKPSGRPTTKSPSPTKDATQSTSHSTSTSHSAGSSDSTSGAADSSSTGNGNGTHSTGSPVPSGHPATGVAPTPSSAGWWLLGGAISILGAAGAALGATRRPRPVRRG